MSPKENNPYVGPRSFRREEGHLFFGREREARDLLSLVASEQLILFYAQSGAGKSSLVNTRLIPNLETKKFEVLHIGRVSGKDRAEREVENIFVFNLISSLIQQQTSPYDFGSMKLSQFLAGLKKNEDGYCYDANAMQTSEHTSRRQRALLIDQFEEIFTTHLAEWKKRDDFFHQLAEAMQDDQYLTVIIIMRDDYIASLDPYTYHFPDCLRVRYYMQRLNRESALKAIKNPVAKVRPFAEGVAEKLVDDLASITIRKSDGAHEVHIGEYVEPVQLQVVCYELWEDLPAEGNEITVNDFLEIGDVDQSLERFYDHRVATIAHEKNVPERAIREWIQKELITAARTRSMVLQNENRDAIISDEVIRAMRGDLLRGELRSGQIWYELSHDRLIKPIITSNAKWFDKHLSIFQKQVVLWMEQGNSESLLLRGSELKDAENEAESLVLTPDEKNFLQACRGLRRREQRDQLLRRGIFSALIVSMILLIAATTAGFMAQESSKTAKIEASNARTAEAIAVENRTTADNLKKEAEARELASEAQANLNTRLDQSILLSLEAYTTKSDLPEARSALYGTMQRALRLRSYFTNLDDTAEEFRYSPDGKYMAVSLKNAGIILWGLSESNETSSLITVHGSDQLDKFNSNFHDRFLFNPSNSEQLVYLSREGLNFWDLNTPQTQNRKPINNHVGAVQQVVFSPDGKTFATMGENGDVTLWNMDASNRSKEPDGSGDSVAFSADHTTIAILNSKAGEITVIDMNGKPVPSSPIHLDKDTVTSFALNRDGTLLAVARKGGYITLWDLTDNTSKLKNTGLATDVDRIFFNSTGNGLVYQTDGSERIATFEESGNSLKELTDEPIADSVLAVSPDGDTFVGADRQTNSLHLWNVLDGNQIKWPQLSETGEEADSCSQGTLASYSPDGKLIASLNPQKKLICILDISDLNEPHFAGLPLSLEDDISITAMAFSHDAKTLAVGKQDGQVHLWDMLSQTWAGVNLASKESVSSVVFSPDDKKLIVGRQDSTFDVLNRSFGNTTTYQTGYQGRISSFGFSPTGKYLYSIAGDGVSILDPLALQDGGNYLLTPKPLFGSSVKFLGPNEEMMVVSGENQKVTSILNLTSMKQIVTESIHSTLVNTSEDGRFAAVKQDNQDSTDETSTITIWTTEEEQPISEPIQGDNVIFSSDSTMTAITDSSNSKIVILDLLKPETPFGEIQGSSPQFAPGQHFLAAKDSGNIVLFDPSKVKIGDESTTIKGDNFVFSPDGRFLAITSSDPTPTIDLWRIQPDLQQMESAIPGTLAFDTFATSRVACFGTGPNQDTMIVSANTRYTNSTVLMVWNITAPKFVNSVVMSGTPLVHCKPGNASVVISAYSASISLWSIDQNKQTTIFSGNLSKANRVDYEFSSDDKTLILTVGDRTTLWDTATAQQIGGAIRGQSGSITVVDPVAPPAAKSYNTVVFSPKNDTFAILYEDGSISLWDTKASSSVQGTQLDLKGRDFDPLTSFAASPLGDSVAVSTQSQIQLFKDNSNGSFLLDKTLVTDNNDHISEVSSVVLSPSGQKLIAYHNLDSSFSFWDTGKRSSIPSDLPRRIINSFRFSPDEKFLLISPSRFTYILYDIATGKSIGNPLVGDSAQFSRDGRYVSLFSLDRSTCTILSSATGKPIDVPVSGFIGFGPKDSDTLLIKKDLDISLWKIEEGKLVLMNSIAKDADSYTFSPDAEMLGITTINASITFLKWDENGHGYHRMTEINRNDVQGELWTFSPQNDIAYFYKSGTLLFDIKAGEYKKSNGEAVTLQGDSITLSPDEKFAAASYYYFQTKTTLIDLDTRRQYDYPYERFRGFSNDGKILVTTNADKNEAIFRDVNSPDTERSCQYPGSLNGATLSQDGRTLALFGNEGVIVVDLSNLQNCNSTEPLVDPAGGAKQMLFTSDGTKLGTLGTDGTILWDTKTGQMLPGPKLKGITGRIDSFRFTKEGDAIIYMSQNGDLYKVALEDMLRKGFQEPSKLSNINNVCPGSLSPFGKFVVAVSLSNKLQIQEVDNPANVHPLKLRNREMQGPCPITGSMAFSQAQDYFALSDNNRIYIYDLQNAGGVLAAQKELIAKQEDIPPYYDLSFLDENFLVTHAAGGRIFLWDIRSTAQVVASDEIARKQVFAEGKMMIYLPAENQLVAIDFERRAFDLENWKTDLCRKINPPVSEDPNSDYESKYKQVCSP